MVKESVQSKTPRYKSSKASLPLLEAGGGEGGDICEGKRGVLRRAGIINL